MAWADTGGVTVDPPIHTSLMQSTLSTVNTKAVPFFPEESYGTIKVMRCKFYDLLLFLVLNKSYEK